MQRSLSVVLGLCLVLGCLARSDSAHAFCGFYVSGADAKLFNNATMVVLMRDGQRTVLSMQNNYEGPPEDFAMVVPVPIVLQEENVKTLPSEVFDRVDQLAAPRLVEYWEQDPCAVGKGDDRDSLSPPSAAAPQKSGAAKEDGGVKVEAQFTVGEYEIVILSASDSAGLDTWLKAEGYKIPDGAEPLLRPYVEEGSKFFVAKVDAKKVKKVDGRTMLSPLRFHYDTEHFKLPVRLGLMNSSGTQDLIVHVLAPGQRYELANYENVTIPTNIDVSPDAKEKFGEFYAALFDATLAKHKGAVVTEYAWDSATCDPCPVPPLSAADLATLGLDVLFQASEPSPTKPSCAPGDPLCDEGPPSPPRRRPMASGMVLTRLHARYGKDTLGEDLVFKKAEPILGGRELRNDGKLEHGAIKGSVNNFQGRYAIRHGWEGLVECKEPVRGVWGGPPKGKRGDGKISSALKLAFAKREGVELASMIRTDVPELSLTPAKPVKKPKPVEEPAPAGTDAGADGGGACSCRAAGGGGSRGWLAFLLGAAIASSRRRR